MINSLPRTDDPNFRVALREARKARNFSFRKLAQLVGIHEVMPSRYENAEHSNATLPSLETWEKLNAVLFPDAQTTVSFVNAPSESSEGQLLYEAPIDKIIAELKRRGAMSVSINW